MNNEIILMVMALFGAVFSGLQIYQIKRIADLCERVTRLETEIEHHFNGKHKSNTPPITENEGRRFS